MNYAVILASGKGSRFGSDIPKQFIKIKNKTILEYTLDVFEKNERTQRIILVVNKDYIDFCKTLKYKKLYKITEGGILRQDSSNIGVNLVEEDDANVLIHDGARPFVKDELINNCYDALKHYQAVNVGVEMTDTVIEINDENIITKIPNRNNLLRCQTPQGFKAALIKKAHKIAKEKNLKVTDDTGLIVNLNLADVYVIKGDINNIKITYTKDIEYAEKHFNG